MITWLHITIISSFAVVIIVLVLLLIRKKCSKPTTPLDIVITDAERWADQNVEGINASNYTSNYNLVFRPRKLPYFSWADHPSLVAHAVENGWPRFCFVTSPSNCNETTNVEMSWEVFEESADHMQKIRLNQGLRKSTTTMMSPSPSGALSVIRTALPLPGPRFANVSFPQEAYFEINFLPNHEQVETSKLIRDIDSNKNHEEVKFGGKIQDCENEIVLAIGLIGGGHLPLKLPGSFQGSVGFNSTGSVYLDGMKLVEESKKEGWGREGNVIGCGYNPAQKKVFFTVNSKLVNEIRCKSEEFGHPLYPTIAANTHVTVAVNLGQSPFKFEAANSQRTPNPCFITTHNLPNSTTTTAPYYELDSKELFSMGRIDGKWKHRIVARSSHESVDSTAEYDLVSEADLFEIVV
ncbi:hypothetical protein C2S52_012319 [Perilla frutescens var. hirtella]|nr:hypothetical protein C2S52_012319 [Perilla frutescens var. hirtella]